MSYIAQMPNLSVLLKDLTIPFAKFMLLASHEHSTSRAASQALKNGFLIRSALLVVRETRSATKISITFGAVDSDG